MVWGTVLSHPPLKLFLHACVQILQLGLQRGHLSYMYPIKNTTFLTLNIILSLLPFRWVPQLMKASRFPSSFPQARPMSVSSPSTSRASWCPRSWEGRSPTWSSQSREKIDFKVQLPCSAAFICPVPCAQWVVGVGCVLVARDKNPKATSDFANTGIVWDYTVVSWKGRGAVPITPTLYTFLWWPNVILHHSWYCLAQIPQ